MTPRAPAQAVSGRIGRMIAASGRMIAEKGFGGNIGSSIPWGAVREDREDREDDCNLRGCAREKGSGAQVHSFTRTPTLSSLSSLSSLNGKQVTENKGKQEAALATSILPEIDAILPILPESKHRKTTASGTAK